MNPLNRILRTPGAGATATEGTAAPTDLAKENALLKQQLEQRDKTEAIIAEKVAAGLTRDQALAAIKHQQDFDARIEELARKSKKAQRS